MNINEFVTAFKQSWPAQLAFLVWVFICLEHDQWLAIPLILIASFAATVTELRGIWLNDVLRANKLLLKDRNELIVQVIHLGNMNRQLRYRLGDEP